MKVTIALLATLTICGAGLLAYQVISLDGRIERLEGQVGMAQAPADGTPAPAAKTSYRDDPALAQRLSDLAARIGQLELSARKEVGGAPPAGAAAAAPEARPGRGPAPGTPGAAPNPGAGRRGGAADARALFGRKDDELTPEERAQRDEAMAQFQQRREEQAAQRVQSTIDGFDGTLQTKLTNQQRLELQQILDGERTSMADLMKAQGTPEERRAQFEAARAAVDQQVQRIMSPEQYQGWITYRAQQPAMGRTGPGGFGGTRSPGGRTQGGQGGRGQGGGRGGAGGGG